MFHPGAWAEAADKLGLGRYEHVAPYERGASFSRLKRALGAKTEGALRDTWMYGKWRTKGSKRGVEVLALVHVASAGVDNVYFTHTIARVDPAFRLGLDIRPRGEVPPIGLCDFDVESAFGRELAVGAVTPTRAQQALGRVDDATDAIARLLEVTRRRWELQVTDSTVDVFTRDLAAGPPLDLAALVARLEDRLEAAALAAKALARRELDADPLVATWASFAEAEKLSLDRERMLVTGDVAGIHVRFGIEGEPGALYTVVIAEWPKLLGAGLRLRRHAPLDAIVDLVAPQDVHVGDKAFDDLFLVRGEPNAVRALFAAPAMRLAIHELALGAKDVSMDDLRLSLRYAAALEAPHLGGITRRLEAIASCIAASGPKPGPYR